MARTGWPCWRVLQHSPPPPRSFPVLFNIPWLPLGFSGPSEGVHPTRVCAIMGSLCTTSCRQGPEELCRQQSSANCSSTSKTQVFGAFPGVSCEMVPGGHAGRVCPLQNGASPALAHRVSPSGTSGHRGGGNARAGGHKLLPCWRANRAYAHQAASPPESCGSKLLVIWVPRDAIPTIGGPRGTQGLRASLHLPTALRSQRDVLFLP